MWQNGIRRRCLPKHLSFCFSLIGLTNHFIPHYQWLPSSMQMCADIYDIPSVQKCTHTSITYHMHPQIWAHIPCVVCIKYSLFHWSSHCVRYDFPISPDTASREMTKLHKTHFLYGHCPSFGYIGKQKTMHGHWIASRRLFIGCVRLSFFENSLDVCLVDKRCYQMPRDMTLSLYIWRKKKMLIFALDISPRWNLHRET